MSRVRTDPSHVESQKSNKTSHPRSRRMTRYEHLPAWSWDLYALTLKQFSNYWNVGDFRFVLQLGPAGKFSRTTIQ